MADVVVVGAGPAGLMVAGELAGAGRSVTVLERHDEVSPLSRAFGVQARTLEAMDSRGLADTLLETGTTLSRVRLFGELEAPALDQITARWLGVLPESQLNAVLAGIPNLSDEDAAIVRARRPYLPADRIPAVVRTHLVE